MKFKIYLFNLLLVFAFSGKVFSQNVIYVNDEEEKTELSEKPVLLPDYKTNLDKAESKVSYKVNVGTSITGSKFGNAIQLYTAPEIRYRLTPKLSISTGFLITNNTVSGYYLAEKEKRNNFTNAYAFAGVDYQATERLRISGEILYGMNKSPYSFNNKGSDYYLRFSAEYKITENLSVGLQVINQNMGYRYPGFRDPFYRNSFNNYYNPYNPFSNY